jgi:hypothetical protein
MVPNKQQFAIGQRYRDANPSAFRHPAWIIEDIFTGTDGLQYVRVYSAANPTERKTLSMHVLADRRRFERA